MLGKILGGRYQIIRHLGGGGFGTTFIAVDKHLPGNPQCVVKQLKPKTGEDPVVWKAARRLFNQEAEVLYLLAKHPQIPGLFAHFEEEQEFYLVQEFIEGHELRQELASIKQFSEPEVINLLRDILEILVFVHQQNVIHRDIKPSNIIRRKADGKLVLIDFGAVKQFSTQMINSHGQTSLTIVVGSPGYMPNEQLVGKPRFSSDIYAVGMLAIQSLTGLNPKQLPEDPYTCEIVWRNFVEVSSELGDILDQMICYDFRQRYQSASEVLAALDSLPPTFVPIHTLSDKAENHQKKSIVTETITADKLSSESGIDYTKLRYLLVNKKWKEADRETENVMLRATHREQEGWLNIKDVEIFPAQDLCTIDELWVKYTDGRFGFSVQQQIWRHIEETEKGFSSENWSCFGDRVGWKSGEGSWLKWEQLTFSTSAPFGHLPALITADLWGASRRLFVNTLLSRLEACKQSDVNIISEEFSLDNQNIVSENKKCGNEQKVEESLNKKTFIGGRIEVIKGDITKQRVDAIVNSSDHKLSGFGVVDGAIQGAGGYLLIRDCLQLNGCAIGEAKITRGYNLPAKWVIHTVGPSWLGGNRQEDKLLAKCYQSCLELAALNSIKTIAFPGISTGGLGFPIERASKIAMTEVTAFLNDNTSIEKVIFVCFEQYSYDCYINLVREILS